MIGKKMKEVDSVSISFILLIIFIFEINVIFIKI